MGNRLSKIYTRTGDSGETGLGDGRRVAKDHPRVEAMGEVDTLNSQLGLLLAELAEAQVQWPALDELISVFGPCQHRLFDLGGELAMPDYQALQESEIERLEQAIDSWNQELGPLKEFILQVIISYELLAYHPHGLLKSLMEISSYGHYLSYTLHLRIYSPIHTFKLLQIPSGNLDNHII